MKEKVGCEVFIDLGEEVVRFEVSEDYNEFVSEKRMQVGKALGLAYILGQNWVVGCSNGEVSVAGSVWTLGDNPHCMIQSDDYLFFGVGGKIIRVKLGESDNIAEVEIGDKVKAICASKDG